VYFCVGLANLIAYFFLCSRENHRTNIMTKLGLHSTLELVRYAVRLGLVDVDLWKE